MYYVLQVHYDVLIVPTYEPTSYLRMQEEVRISSAIKFLLFIYTLQQDTNHRQQPFRHQFRSSQDSFAFFLTI
jgi:hypothetical protein